MQKQKTLGLCAGRHQIPVDVYIYPAELDPTDFAGMYACAEAALHDVDHATVYVTGLTAAMLAVVSVCVDWRVGLTAMHYDRTTGEYLPQVILRAGRCVLCGHRDLLGQFCASCGAH